MRAPAATVVVSESSSAGGGGGGGSSGGGGGGGGSTAPDYPPTLTDLSLWVDGRATAYSDTGATVIAAPFTGRVRRVNYPAPLSGNAQAANDTLRPWREPNGLNFQFGAHHKLVANAATASNWDDCTIALTFRPRDQNSSNGLALVASSLVGAAGGLGVRLSNANLLSIDSAGSWNVAPTGSPTAYATVPTGSACSLIVRANATGLRVTCIVDGVRTEYSKAIDHYASATTASWTIGSDVLYGTSGTHCSMNQVIVASRAISDAENELLVAWLEAHPAPSFPTELPMIMVSGDSVAFGLNLDRSLGWPYKSQQSINNAAPSSPVNMTNVAVSGHTIAMQQTDYPTRMAPFYSSFRSKNIFVAAVATNNMATLGQDGPTALGLYYAYLDDKLARGWKPVACTVLPRNAGGAFDSARAYFNTHLRAEWAARGYAALADVALVSGMGADGDWANTTNYSDGIHPTQVGDDLVEPTYRAAIQTALA